MPANVAFSGLSPLVVEDVIEDGNRIVVQARTPARSAACPRCGARSSRVHGYHDRTVARVPFDGRPVTVRVQIRRLMCLTPQCCTTFREQVPGVLERYQRRTTRLTGQVRSVVRELAGRAGARLLSALSVRMSRHSAIRALLRIPLPLRVIQKAVGVDDFALRRCHRYATVIIDAGTHQRLDVLPDRRSDTLAAWLARHPGVEVVVRDGSAANAEAVRTSLPDATQASDRWYLGHGLAAVVGAAVVAHRGCWAQAGPKRQQLTREHTTLQRWHTVHELLDQGVGLLDCSRRLGVSRNTVKRYRRMSETDRLCRPPQYSFPETAHQLDHEPPRRPARHSPPPAPRTAGCLSRDDHAGHAGG